MASIHKLPSIVDPTGARSFPRVRLETSLLVQFLAAKPEGSTVTYTEMEALIGQPVTPKSPGYQFLRSAKHMLVRDHSVVADAEPKIGVRICNNEEKLLVAGRDAKRSRRAVFASRQKLRAVEYETLTDGKKAEWNARMSILGALDLMSAPRALVRVTRAISDHPLPSAKTLELFR